MIRGQEIGEIIPFPVWIIPFPVFKTRFKLVDKILKHFVKEVFDQSSGNRRINSISCLDNSISCFQNQLWTPKFSAEVCRLPIQHFNSVLEPYMSKKIFGRALPICNSTLQQVFDLYISYCQSSARVPITNSTLQQRFGAIYVHKILQKSSANFQFNTSTVFWPTHI